MLVPKMVMASCHVDFFILYSEFKYLFIYFGKIPASFTPTILPVPDRSSSGIYKITKPNTKYVHNNNFFVSVICKFCNVLFLG